MKTLLVQYIQYTIQIKLELNKTLTKFDKHVFVAFDGLVKVGIGQY
jgi:hypothetical protein